VSPYQWCFTALLKIQFPRLVRLKPLTWLAPHAISGCIGAATLERKLGAGPKAAPFLAATPVVSGLHRRRLAVAHADQVFLELREFVGCHLTILAFRP
jgi:hypothetical protein